MAHPLLAHRNQRIFGSQPNNHSLTYKVRQTLPGPKPPIATHGHPLSAQTMPRCHRSMNKGHLWTRNRSHLLTHPHGPSQTAHLTSAPPHRLKDNRSWTARRLCRPPHPHEGLRRQRRSRILSRAPPNKGQHPNRRATRTSTGHLSNKPARRLIARSQSAQVTSLQNSSPLHPRSLGTLPQGAYLNHGGAAGQVAFCAWWSPLSCC